MKTSDVTQVIFYDTETTGLSPEHDFIVEIAASTFTGEVFTTLVNPGIPIPAQTSRIHGIDNKTVAQAPNTKTAIESFVAFCKAQQGSYSRLLLIAHNGFFFDDPLLNIAASRVNILLPDTWIFLDSLKWAENFLNKIPKKSLQSLRALFNLPSNNAHRALDDVVTLQKMFDIMTDNLLLEDIIKIYQNFDHHDKMPFGPYVKTKVKGLPHDYVLHLQKLQILNQPSFFKVKQILLDNALISEQAYIQEKLV